MLVVGLGNPGDIYKNSRHNVGFMVVDEILSTATTKSKISKNEFKGELYKVGNNLFLKPQTFMNLSGESVISVTSYFKIESQDVVVVHDDLDLEFGALRFKNGGGHGGHNGLKSIDSKLGVSYNRVRVGIGKPQDSPIEISDYVLSKFTKDENLALGGVLSKASKAIEHLLSGERMEKIKALYSQKRV